MITYQKITFKGSNKIIYLENAEDKGRFIFGKWINKNGEDKSYMKDDSVIIPHQLIDKTLIKSITEMKMDLVYGILVKKSD